MLLFDKIIFKSSKEVSQVITDIRNSKLPDPKILGNAGSFFKNVLISLEKFEELKKDFPDIKFYNEGNLIKIPFIKVVSSINLLFSASSVNTSSRNVYE